MRPAAIIVLTAVVSVVLTSAVWIGGIVLAYRYYIGSPPPFAIQLDYPREVVKDEVFELVARASNPTHDPLELGSIDIYNSLLDGFSIVGIDPEPNDRMKIFDFTTFYFSQDVEPGGSFAVTFKLKALKEGVWTGDVDFCTPEEKFVTSSATVKVRKSAENP